LSGGYARRATECLGLARTDYDDDHEDDLGAGSVGHQETSFRSTDYGLGAGLALMF
jgi:hypothetical protein